MEKSQLGNAFVMTESVLCNPMKPKNERVEEMDQVTFSFNVQGWYTYIQ